ncbi:hypothetical protein JCM11641_006299 [Rhodosporidiobolus odoratus]
MVSFCCEQCNDTVKKPKLDQHAGRCRGAQFTCIDCNVTFEGTSYRGHTSCVSEEQRYHKSVYKAPKGKGQKGQKNQQQQQAQTGANQTPVAPSTPSTPAPAASAEDQISEKKRAREDEEEQSALTTAEAKEEKPIEVSEEPKKKKSKKDKKPKKSEAEKEGESVAANGAEAQAEEEPLSAFLNAVVAPLLTADALSLAQLRDKVVEAAKEKGRTEGREEIEAKLWEGLKVGGKKGKVKAEFA